MPSLKNSNQGGEKGEFSTIPHLSSNDERRFWSKVEKTDTCWLWRGSLNTTGYGQIKIDGRAYVAHRVAYVLSGGFIPDGLTLDHICRRRNCVRPSHLEPVTQRENTLRGVGLAAQYAKRTHCPAGHPYDDENTHIYQGRRYCRACHRARSAAWRNKEEKNG